MRKTLASSLLLAALAIAQPAKQLAAPDAMKEAFRAHAVGYQVYACEAGGKWSRSEPIAAVVTGNGEIIRHFRDTSPAWDSLDGSKVNGLLKPDGSADQSAPSAKPNSIPQLGLNARASGSGLFAGIEYIVRTNTGGGVKPADPCSASTGKRVSVYYEADYIFYKKQATKY